MSGCVVDASALVAALVDDGEEGRWAEGLVLRGPLAAPELVLAETTNVLRRLESHQRIPNTVADSAFDDLLRLDLDLYPFAPFAERIWELRPNLTAYDAWYVAVAEALGLPLATLDSRLAKSDVIRCEIRDGADG